MSDNSIDREKLKYLIKLKELELEQILDNCQDVYKWSFEENDGMLFVDILLNNGIACNTMTFFDEKDIFEYEEQFGEYNFFDNFIKVSYLLNALYYISDHGINNNYKKYIDQINNTVVIKKDEQPIDMLMDGVANGELVITGTQNYIEFYPHDMEKYIGVSLLDVIDELKQCAPQIVIRGRCGSLKRYSAENLWIEITTREQNHYKNKKNLGIIKYIGYVRWRF